MSRQIYSEQPVSPHLEKLVSEAWSLLPEPAVSVDVDVSRLNWFVATDRFHTTRRTRLSTVIDALETLDAGGDLTKKVISTRYTAGLPSVDGERRREFLRFLRRFAAPNS
ncbi:hypothetical protein [Mycolicibacterium elephantis]|uniref:hypothetical protein n=1 Tax=Mycolicibacterium elephantis TaxID=81858 RepID=UPI000FE20887|nr:hypothetical protein [Mycolicibacterium elephantis]MCV7220105.1 hypothetical protein [Mycolicibacterium elephantis]